VLTEKLIELEREHSGLERDLANPEVFSNSSNFLKINRRYGELLPIVKLWHEYRDCENAILEAQELLTDPEMRDLAVSDLEENKARQQQIELELDVLLIPKDPRDERNVILEIRAGAGGDEAGLFAGDLMRMYSRYAEMKGIRLEIVEESESALGGYSKVVAEMSGNFAYRSFKFEMGVHRVQRVPATESQGRIHTSTVTIAVIPEAEETEFDLDLSQVRIDVFRAQGAGGQGVNTTDSAVRAVWKTGTDEELIIICQDGRSQIKNREKALVILRSRLVAIERAKEEERSKLERQSMIGTGDRSEKIRTYNYPQNRITDHRLTGENKNFPLDILIEGKLEPLMDALAAWDREGMLERLAEKVE
jgi:peptide chain release factor 1